jgi:NAD(P)-dependent dehydrogenase (short-subunit alcohol dehydrogenase family)
VAVMARGTGALGRALSPAFLDKGATVVVTYRTQTEFDALVQAAAANALHLEGQRIDVTDDLEAHRFIEGIVGADAKVIHGASIPVDGNQ